jgi:hypothetical protein
MSPPILYCGAADTCSASATGSVHELVARQERKELKSQCSRTNTSVFTAASLKGSSASRTPR